MLTTISIAFMLGLVGSLHCIGMCGPLALAVPVPQNNLWRKAAGTLVYNLGRMSTYAFMGLLLGLAGQGIAQAFNGAQNKVSIILGILILVYVIIPRDYTGNSPIARASNNFFNVLREKMGKLFFRKSGSSLFIIGLLNGLLPCGMVYLALASSIATGTALKGMTFMAFFGAGTLPAMMSITLFGNLLPAGMRLQFRRMVPYFLAFIGTILILRGLHLGIPFISPGETAMGDAVNCHK